MADLMELAERVEALSGQDREIDCLIAIAIRFAYEDIEGVELEADQFGDRWTVAAYAGKSKIKRFLPPMFTASIDAAETLVPEYCKDNWSLIGGSRWQALVGPDDYQADAATPALALCAAALRARASNG